MTEESKKIRPRAGRLVVPILLVVFYVWYGSLILELPQGPGEEGPLGPSFIPWLWASLLIVLTLVEIGMDSLWASRASERVIIERKGVLDALILCLLLAGFAVLNAIRWFFRRSHCIPRRLHLVERESAPGRSYSPTSSSSPWW